MRLLIVALLLARTAAAATFTVTNTEVEGPGSLRDAIVNANSNPGVDTILFNIAGPTPHTISVAPGVPLPDLTGSFILDGTTQPGYAGSPVVIVSGGISKALVINASNSIVRGLNMLGGDFSSIVDVVGDGNTIEDCVISDGYRGTLRIVGDHNIVRRNTFVRKPSGTFLMVSGLGNEIGPGNVANLFLYEASDTHVFENDLSYAYLGPQTDRTHFEDNLIVNLNNYWTHAGPGYGAGNTFVGNTHSALDAIQISEYLNDSGDGDTGGVNNHQNSPALSSATAGQATADVHVELDSSATATQSLLIEFHKGIASSQYPPFPDLGVVHSECVAGNTVNRSFTFPAAGLTPGDYIAAIATSYADSTCTQVLDGSSEFSAPVQVAQSCTPVVIGNFSDDAAITVGDTVELFVEATGTTLTYAWYRDEGSGFALMPGMTSSTLTVSPLITTRYRAEVSGACGNAQTGVITVDVCIPPIVSLIATPSIAFVGDEIHVEVVITGSEPLTIQWLDASRNVLGEDVRELSFIAAEGALPLIITTNSCGSQAASVEAIVCTRIDDSVKVSSLGVSQQLGALTELSVENPEKLSSIQWYERDRQGRLRLLRSDDPTLVVPSRKVATYIVRLRTACEQVEVSVTVGPQRRRSVRPGS